jgi:hypothetical protein
VEIWCIFGKPIWCHLCQIQLWAPSLPNLESCQRASRTHSGTFTSKLAFKSSVQLNMTRRPWMMNVRWKRNVKIKYVNSTVVMSMLVSIEVLWMMLKFYATNPGWNIQHLEFCNIDLVCLKFSHLVKVGTSITLKKYHAIDEEISIMWIFTLHQHLTTSSYLHKMIQ